MLELVLITGISGAGKTTALKKMEDLGYEAIDNLPLSLLPLLLQSTDQTKRKLAIGADVRARDFSSKELVALVQKVEKDRLHKVKTLFLDSNDDKIVQRFSETRRKHPLAQDAPVLDGILQERELLAPIFEAADIVLDTSEFTLHELRSAIEHVFSPQESPLSLFVKSFSFSKGLPRDADLVFDVRFLQNPHYETSLRDLTGLDESVGNYIMQDPMFDPFFGHLHSLILPLLPRFKEGGKSYLTIAIGCTGGKHRSVFTAESLATKLQNEGYAVAAMHRDIPADTKSKLAGKGAS